MPPFYDPILSTDSYKLCHWKQYPPGTENIYSYYESRGGKSKEVVFYGLHYILHHYLPEYIIEDEIGYAEDFSLKHFGHGGYFNREGWEYLAREYPHELPLRIRAVPEGTVVPTGQVLMTIENTDPKCFWLTNFIETALSQVWYPISVATLSREIKKTLKKALDETCALDEKDKAAKLDFMLHDFGMRGATTMEAAMLGGSAHLVNFKGSDTMTAIQHIRQHHRTDEMPGYSVPASEHSTMTSWGESKESDAYANMLDSYNGPVSIVSDSYDIFHAVRDIWGEQLKEKVRCHNGTVIIRPDSGDPVAVILGVLSYLGESFGTTTNALGYKVLPDYVRVLWGDGLNHRTARHQFSIKRIVKCLKAMKWSIENIAFGMGGGLLQGVNRDTHKLALKCSHATINGVGHDVYKTASGKISKRGRLKLIYDHKGNMVTVPEKAEGKDLLVDYYTPGHGLHEVSSFDDIRKRAAL